MLPIIIRYPRFFLSILKTAAYDLIGMKTQRHRFEQFVRPGDIIVSLGAGWGIPHYMKHIAAAKRRCGIKFSILIYDLIPIEYESFVEGLHVVQFRNWLQEAIPAARDVDHDLASWARSRGVGVFHGRNRECVNSPGFKLNASITLAGSG